MKKITEKGQIETVGQSVFLIEGKISLWQANGLHKLAKSIEKNGQIITHRIGKFGFTAKEVKIILADERREISAAQIAYDRAQDAKWAAYEASKKAVENAMTLNGKTE